MDYFTEYKSEGFEAQKLFRLPKRAEKRMLNRGFTEDLVITDIGYYPEAEHHLVERSKGVLSDILVFCVKGEGWFESEGKLRKVGALDVFWIPAKGAHRYGTYRENSWEIYWVHAYGGLVESLLKWTPLTRERPLIKVSNVNAVKRQFNAVLQRVERGYTDHTLLEMARFFVSVITLLHVDAGPMREVRQREKIEKAMDKMRETLSSPLSLAEYARIAGFSVSQFSHHFKRYYGVSPMAYFAELRIQSAREMLDSTELSIKEVAWKLGFEDPLYFSRIFKKITGISPLVYRRESI